MTGLDVLFDAFSHFWPLQNLPDDFVNLQGSGMSSKRSVIFDNAFLTAILKGSFHQDRRNMQLYRERGDLCRKLSEWYLLSPSSTDQEFFGLLSSES